MSELRIAVIGAGHLGRIHAKLLQQVDGAKLVAISDPNEAARKIAQEQFDVDVEADYHNLMDHIDAAIIAAPTDFHADIAKTLLKAGKHLLVEKPLAADGTDAQRLAMVAAARRCTLQVGHVERFNPAFSALGDLAEDVKYIEAVRASRFPGRCLDVGVVMDLMIHDLDLVLSMSDASVTSVSASGLSVVSNHEDIAEARIEFECGLVANLKASRISPQPAREMKIFGSRGFAEIDFGSPSLSYVKPSFALADRSFNLAEQTDNPLGYSEQLFGQDFECETVDLTPRNAILDELHDFVLSIQTGVSPIVDGAAGARAVAIADKVLQAIDQRAWYRDATPLEVGPHALAKESIGTTSRKIHQARKAA